MTVEQLIEKLQKFPKDLKVVYLSDQYGSTEEVEYLFEGQITNSIEGFLYCIDDEKLIPDSILLRW